MTSQHEPHNTMDDQTAHESLGQFLKRMREAKQLSLEHVADRLHLSRQRIIDIENDDYKHTSAETYAKGYLRSYAKLLGLDPEDIIVAFDHARFATGIVRNRPELIEERPVTVSDSHMKWITYGIVAGLLLLVGLWWRSGHNNTAKVQANLVPMVAEQKTEPKQVTASHPATQTKSPTLAAKPATSADSSAQQN